MVDGQRHKKTIAVLRGIPDGFSIQSTCGIRVRPPRGV
jgi:hypothetical protein